ncbi:MAG: glycosyltransferase [Myxococcota bacterium]|nr:glycosyltransferase [Myxococcota bacterium]MDW8362254.1 glycosyltransferase [Myxococcales bacterium]
MSEPVLSVVVPVRDRTGTRLDNCLRSLRWQRDVGGPVEIVISDYGSDPPHAEAIDALARRHEARVARTPRVGLWNRSRALNVGIRAAGAPHVLCTDADMIFAPDFLATVIGVLRDEPRAFVLCRCRDLPPEVPEQPWTVDDFPSLLARARWRHALGVGACQAAARAFFERVRGYDERYVHWGYEDRDMVARAERAGLRIVWIHERTSMLHQWHPTTKGDRPWWRQINKLRFFLTRRVLVKNPGGWGCVADG